MGVYFVSFVGQYGYDRVLGVLGRHMRDFLNGLDNLHEYLKFSYPRMKAPSFFCENESPTGLTLHYRSTRRGFLWYTIGQIREVGRHFYKTDVTIEVLKEETLFDTLHVTMRLTFDNRAFFRTLADQRRSASQKGGADGAMMPVRAFLFLEIFPFCVVFDEQLLVKTIGNSLQAVMPDIVGKKLTAVFDLVKPLIECTWVAIHSHTNNIFELCSVDPIKVKEELLDDSSSNNSFDTYPTDDDTKLEDRLLHLKGQMMYMEEWQSMVYLGTPVMRDLDAMVHTGLYINDLSMHDFSRDMVLAGQQQSAELKLALDQELQKSKQLEESMRKLDIEMRRTDELLYQMIPRQVADRLRKGEPALQTCQFFESVTILFSDVVKFTEICSRITPMQVVSMLNAMYSLFDQLTEKHNVYKVETIGDAYMVVSGCPEVEERHADRVCLMALDMVMVIGGLEDPSTGDSLRIRVGIHTGAVVAGVVGLKMPRYCLFGDTVNTASRMESTSEALKIHISQKTKDKLDITEWNITERRTITVKGKGEMKTYWLHGRLRPTEVLPHARLQDSRMLEPLDASDSRSLYSPVTFEEVSRYSPIPSPTNSSLTSEILPQQVGDRIRLSLPSQLAVPVNKVLRYGRNTQELPLAVERIAHLSNVAIQTSPPPPFCPSGLFTHCYPTVASLPAYPFAEQDVNSYIPLKPVHPCPLHSQGLEDNPSFYTLPHAQQQVTRPPFYSQRQYRQGNVKVIHVAPRIRDQTAPPNTESQTQAIKSNACTFL